MKFQCGFAFSPSLGLHKRTLQAHILLLLNNIKPHLFVEKQIKVVSLIIEGCQVERDWGKEKPVKESMPIAMAQVNHVLSRAPVSWYNQQDSTLNCNS